MDFQVAGRSVRLTHPDKVLYGEQGLTKRRLAQYYAEVGDRLLHYAADRPLTLVRCPDGEAGDCFYQKHATGSIPSVVGRVEVQEQSKRGTYLYVRSVVGVVALVQLGALELHVWSARRDRLDRPDQLIFDLDRDPESVGWGVVVRTAIRLRDRLRGLGLESFVKTTGGKGVHLVAPLERRAPWSAVRNLAHALALELERAEPDLYTAKASKRERKGRIFIDYLRNARGATAVAPYSTRARAGAPVATPLRWDELTSDVDPKAYTVESIPRRLAALESDPWAGWDDLRQSVTQAMLREVGASRA